VGESWAYRAGLLGEAEKLDGGPFRRFREILSAMNSDAHLPPSDSVEQAVGEAYGWRFAGSLENFLLQLPG
jgi:hypothetical protein